MTKNKDLLEMALSAKVVNSGKSWGGVEAAILAEHVFDLDDREKGYFFDTKQAAYVSRWTGKPVQDATVRRSVESYNSEFVGANMDKHTDKFIEGKMDLPTWQKKMAGELKQGHVINATVGAGGRANMNYSKWGRVGNALRQQYNWLNNFSVEIANGNLTPAQIQYRVNMYAKSVRSSYFAGQRVAKEEAGLTMERRVTTSGNPCDPCAKDEKMGWQPLGTLPVPGTDCKGLTNCMCYMEYRKIEQGSEEEEAIKYQASMSDEDAAKWAKDSAYPSKLYHGTNAAGAANIPKEGFDLSRTANGRMYGDGVYFTTNEAKARSYGQVLETRVNVQKTYVANSSYDLQKETDNAMKWYKTIPKDKQFELVSYNDLLTKHLKNQGYDSVVVSNENIAVVFDPNNITVIR